MKNSRQLFIPIGLSLISGLLVSSQVLLTRPSGNTRTIIALRDLPKGTPLHPRDFQFTPTNEPLEPGVVDDQAVHVMWRKTLLRDLQEGDALRLDDVDFAPYRPVVAGRMVRLRGMEILQEEGED